MSSTFEITPAFIYDVWLQRAAVVAGYTLLVYDYFLTLGDEVEYIWSAPWTLVKSIYLANRYIMLLGQTLVCIQATGFIAAVTGGCEFYAMFLAVYILVSLETAHVLVVLRAWAIWGGDRRILQSMVLAYVACFVSIIIAVSKGEDFSNFEPTVTSVCYEPAPDHAWIFYFSSLVVDSLLFCMSMTSLWSYRKSFKHGSLELVKALTRGVTTFYIASVCYDILGIVSVTRYQNSPRLFAITGNYDTGSGVSWSSQELSQVVNQQLEALSPWTMGAEEAFMALGGNKFKYRLKSVWQ
ncbi:hypothetical protein EDC04DRAFT_2894244 [Pisolithus marmoratus]|nr:hypothetical protein EDC04DRAFT_2894244 [Pisolithus marmoratus]